MKKISFLNDSIKKYRNNKKHREKIKEKFKLNELPVIDFNDLFPNQEFILKPITFLPGGSTICDYALLQGLAKKFQITTYLEIGTWRGESIANVSPFVNLCFSLSLSDEDLRSRGLSEDIIKTSRIFSKNIDNIKHIEADSQIYDFSKIGKIDLAFIDGDHSYESVKNDTKNIFSIIGENGIIVWHDYLNDNGTIRYEVLHGILAGSPAINISKLFHISNTKSAVFLKEGFPINNNFKPLDNIFEIILKIKN